MNDRQETVPQRVPNLAKLTDVFHVSEIEWRVAEYGLKADGTAWAKCFAYVTNRAIQTRLDECCGPENWQCEFREVAGGFICRIGIRCQRDVKLVGSEAISLMEWVWKEDGAERPEFEPLKGGISGSMKRAAVQWGIGRYLYDLPTGWAETSMERKPGWYHAYGKDKRTGSGFEFYWIPPRLPEWAVPKGTPAEAVPQEEHAHQQPAPAQPKTGAPATPSKPACPKCGKSEYVLADKQKAGHFFCWKNAEKNKHGCGHKWSGQQQAPGIQTPSAFDRAKEEIANAVKKKSTEYLGRVVKVIVDRTSEGVITVDQAAELEDLATSAKKAIESSMELDAWYETVRARQAENPSAFDPNRDDLQEMRDRF